MPLLRAEAEKLSNNQLLRGVITEIIDKDDMFAILPFTQVNGKAYVYNREGELADGQWLDPNDEVPESASKFVEVTTKLRILAGDVDVDKFLASTMGDTNPQKALQIAAKAKGMSRQYRAALVEGDSATNAKQFDGLKKLVTTAQTLDAKNAALTFSMLDELVDAVPLKPDCLIMRSGTYRAYLQLLRATSGTNAPLVMLKNFGHPMLTHNGVPIIVNDYIKVDEGDESSKSCYIYAARFNEVDGVHGLFGGPNAGMVVEDIGTVQNKDATRTRIKWYCGLALKSTKSLAALKGVPNI
nr:MAG TPA: major capsid protein [Caudoviricetes sp.]